MEEWRIFCFVRECQLFACKSGLWYQRTKLLDALRALIDLAPPEVTYADHLYIAQIFEIVRAGLARHVHSSVHREYGGKVGRCPFDAVRVAKEESAGDGALGVTEDFMKTFEKYLDRLEAAHPIPAAIKAAALINEHIGERMSLLDVARAVGSHPVALRSQLKELYGITFREYKTDCQLRRAAALLAETDRPIAEIAEQCGFHCLDHFYRVFMRFRHITPGRYRHKRRSTRDKRRMIADPDLATAADRAGGQIRRSRRAFGVDRSITSLGPTHTRSPR